MGRGGHRDGAGRKSGWNHADTQTIRVPKVFAAQLMDIARRMDLGESEIFTFPTSPKVDPVQSIVESEIPQVNPDQMNIFSLIPEVIESVTESNTTSLSMRGLAKRLGVDHSTISRKLKACDSKQFSEWIQLMNKGNWNYDPVSKRFIEILDDDCPDF
jgi:hypothetical protein